MRQPITTSVLAAATMLALTAGNAQAIQIQNAAYDFWHQLEGEDQGSVIRMEHFDYGDEVPERIEEDIDDGMGGTIMTARYDPGSVLNVSAGFQTGVLIDPEFILTQASPLLERGYFQLRVGGVNTFVKDFWVPGGNNANFNDENIALLRLEDPVPAGHAITPLIPPGFDARGMDTEIVSFGSILFGQPGVDGEGGDPDGDFEAGFAGGFRRSGFNKFDVTELNEVLNANSLLALDQDQFPGQLINDVDKDVPVVLEASLNGNDAGAIALVNGMVAGIGNGTFTVSSAETNQAQTISLFTDLGAEVGTFGPRPSWSEDIAFFLDRGNWVLDDAGDLAPTTPGGWQRSLAGFDITFLRDQNSSELQVLVFDTDITPTAFIDGVCQGMGQGCLGFGGGGPGGGGGGLSPAQQAALATLEFFQALQDAEAFGEGAQFGVPVGGMGMFANFSGFDHTTTGGTVVLPADFSNTGDLGEADFGLIIDYNRDGQLGGLDIDTLYDHVGDVIDPDTTTIFDVMFDLTFDLTVSQDDVDVLVMGFFGTDYGDLNLNGTVGAEDYTTATANLGGSGGWADGDVNGDGLVTQADLDILMANLVTLLGDANNDGQVTGADLIAVQQNFGASGVADDLLIGDADGDGQVTGADLIAVQQNFGAAGGGQGNAPVPEPATIALLGLGGLAMARRRR